MSEPVVAAALAVWLFKSTLLLVLTSGAAYAARKLDAPAALRHWLWLLAIASAAVLPFATALAPVRIAVLPNLETAPAQAALSSAPVGWTRADAATVCYAVIASALLLRILVGQWRLALLWRKALPVASVAAEACSLASALGLQRRVDVRLAGEKCAPMTWGAFNPKILLPGAAVGWPAGRRRLVLMHELAHVARADSATQMFVSVVTALYWFQPALWIAAAQLRREQEHACDDRVLLAGASAHSYAATLLDVAAGARPSTGGAVAMAGHSQLEERLGAIVGNRRRALGGATMALATGGALSALAAVAVAAPVRAPIGALLPVSAFSSTAAPMPATATSQLPPHGSVPGKADAREDLRGISDLGNLAGKPEPRARRAPRSQLPDLTPLPAVPALPAGPAHLAAVPDIPSPPSSPTPVVAPTPPTPPTPVTPLTMRGHRRTPSAQPP